MLIKTIGWAGVVFFIGFNVTALAEETKKATPATIDYVYELDIPSTNAPGVTRQTDSSNVSECGGTKIIYFYYNKVVAGLTKWNMDKVKLMVAIGDGGYQEQSELKTVYPEESKVSILFAQQRCELKSELDDNYFHQEEDRYGTNYNCVNPSWDCSPPEFWLKGTKAAILRVTPDTKIR